MRLRISACYTNMYSVMLIELLMSEILSLTVIYRTYYTRLNIRKIERTVTGEITKQA